MKPAIDQVSHFKSSKQVALRKALSAQEQEPFEAWLKQWKPSKPSANLSERLGLALEFPPPMAMSEQEQAAFEACLSEFKPQQPSSQLSQRFANSLEQSQTTSLLRFPFRPALAVAASLALMAWAASSFFQKTADAGSEIPTLSNKETKSSTEEQLSARQTDLAQSPQDQHSNQLDSPSLSDLATSETRPTPGYRPFEFFPSSSAYQPVELKKKEDLLWPEAAFSGPPPSSVARGWQQLDILRPNFQWQPSPAATQSERSEAEKNKHRE